MFISSGSTTKLQYLIVSLIVVFSGSLIPFIFSENYSTFLVVFLLFLLGLSPFFKHLKTNSYSYFYLLLIILFLLVLMLFRGEFDNSKEYVGVIGRLLIAYLATILISKKKFIAAYTDLFVFYSAFSLIMYLIGFVSLDFIRSLPISFNDAGTGYRHLYFYFYQGIDTWNFRNSGLFWEAGAYQVFLSLALLFEIYFIKKSIARKVILIAAVASTVSTIGILVLAILSFARLFSRRSLYNVFLPSILILTLFIFQIFDELLWGKFDGENISGVDRIVGQLADLQLFTGSPVFGVGYAAYPDSFRAAAYALGAVAPTSTNSFTGLLALNGIFYSLLLFLPMFNFFIKNDLKIGNRILILVIFIILLSSQGLFNQLLFLVLLFYGLQNGPDLQTGSARQRSPSNLAS